VVHRWRDPDGGAADVEVDTVGFVVDSVDGELDQPGEADAE
jgi:hypothetical protein